jgi:hypothetical protein
VLEASGGILVTGDSSDPHSEGTRFIFRSGTFNIFIIVTKSSLVISRAGAEFQHFGNKDGLRKLDIYAKLTSLMARESFYHFYSL